jgi:hypothetical protein
MASKHGIVVKPKVALSKPRAKRRDALGKCRHQKTLPRQRGDGQPQMGCELPLGAELIVNRKNAEVLRPARTEPLGVAAREGRDELHTGARSHDV